MSISSTIPAPPAAAPGAAADRRTRFSGLDGLRAIAVLLVMIYHFFPTFSPGGFIGVDMFFVLSGFLITALLLRERAATGRIALGRFWQRRARRLLPALAAVVLLCSSVAALIGGDVLVGIGRQVLGAFTFSYNWLAVAGGSDYFESTTLELFRNLWSLSVEEQFYLLWPLLFLAVLWIPRARMRVAVLLAGALASAGWMWFLTAHGADATRVYYGTDTHSFGLLLGAALAMHLHRREDATPGALPARGRVRRALDRHHALIGTAAVLGLLAAAWFLRETGNSTFRWGLPLVSVFGALAIWAAVRGGRWGRALDSAPLRYIGERSYGLYLWHWPVLVLLLAANPSALGSGFPEPSVALIALLLTFLLAGLSYRFMELPIRRHGIRPFLRRIAAGLRGSALRPRIAALGAGVLAVALLGGTTTAILIAPDRSSAQLFIERGAHSLQEATPPVAEAAPPGPAEDLTDGNRISAIGDSVMLAAAPALQVEFPGIAVDAAVSRSLRMGLEIIREQAAAGTLRPVVVVGLGTNGPITRDQLDELRTAIGPDRELLLVDASAPRAWIPEVNQTLREFTGGNPRVGLADWSGAIEPRAGELLARDRIHPGDAGGALYAQTVHATLERMMLVPEGLPPGAEQHRQGTR